MGSNDFRKNIIVGLIILSGLVLLVKLFFLQVVNQEYKALADSNIKRKLIAYPSRGLVYDRHGSLLVTNEPVYDLMVIPKNISDIDTARFCSFLNIDKKTFKDKIKEASKWSRHKPSVFLKQIPKEVYASFQEYQHMFQGFYEQVRPQRSYNYNGAAHIFGYIGEVSSRDIAKESEYYEEGDYIGVSGIEKTYESLMRGVKGQKLLSVDNLGRVKGKYKEGVFDTNAVTGSDIRLTIDIELQEYAEKLLANKVGSLVAIEPATGEILALVSRPGYDPNVLNGRERGENFKMLKSDTLKPMFNRAVTAWYIPGSLFKTVVALVGLEEGSIKPNTYYKCGGSYKVGRMRLNCSHGHKSCGSVMSALEQSCNPWFWQAFRSTIEQPKYESQEAAFVKWSYYLDELGIGKPLGVDLPNEDEGNIPTVGDYNRMHGEGRWGATNIISLGIGQGEMGMTTLQMANLMSTVANSGYYFTPHLLLESSGDSLRRIERFNVSIAEEHFGPVIKGLERVVSSGTAKLAAIKGHQVAGKTGTADNPMGEPHSIFAGFAPSEDAQIAVAVVVENAGFGSTYAAPIASLVMEKYLNKDIDKSRKWLEDRMLKMDLVTKDEPSDDE